MTFSNALLSFVLSVCVLAWLPNQSKASDAIILEGNLSLGLISHAELVLSDQVTDNCWTNATKILSETRLKLEQNDIAVLKSKPGYLPIHAPRIVINAYGYRVGSGCIATAEFDVFYYSHDSLHGDDGLTYFTNAKVELFSKSRLASNRGPVNESFDNFFTGAVSEFIAIVLSGRRSEKVKQALEHVPLLRLVPSPIGE